MAEACGSRTQTLDSQLTANDDVAASARFQLESIGVRTVQVPARFCLLLVTSAARGSSSQLSCVGCWDRARARRHKPRFPRPPDNPGRPNFTRSGLEPWPILHEPSQTPRGLSADSHTPHDSGLPTASFHLRRRLIPTLCPGIARMTKPPSVQSPFAPRPVLPARGRRVPPPG